MSSQQSQAPLRPAILIVSDTATADPSTDKSAAALKEVFVGEGSGKWGEPEVLIVPDNKDRIQSAVTAWTDSPEPVNLIITTGGTGFTPRDNTPEAISPLLHRNAPGLVHGMLAASYEITPFAMMSRPVAGTRHKTIIITLPGSPKGAKENLQAVLKLLPHACMQAAGEDSRKAHAGGVAKLEKDAGIAGSSTAGNTATTQTQAHQDKTDHSHSHSHKHDHGHGHGHGHKIPKAHTNPADRPPQSNDPRLGATHRARQSPYPMLSVADAVSTILEVTPAPTKTSKPMSADLAGYIVCADITSAEAVPAYRASTVDGYAVIASADEAERKKMKGVFPVASVSHAQASSVPPPLKAGEIARITTGAPLPENSNAVVMVEDTVIAALTDDKDKPEEKEVEILTDEITPGENVREPGSDIKLGATILHAGQRISSLGGEIGVLAASGTKEVPVYRRPRVGVMSTGDEVMDITYTGDLSNGMIRDSNRPSLLTLLCSWDLCDQVVDLGVARDTPNSELEEKIRGGFRTEDLDVIVTTGGVSMGELDLLKPTVERSMGGTVHFGRVNMKPGKPTTFASVPVKPTDGSSQRTDRLIFGLPGNPASALVTANLFLLPCLQKLAGLPETQTKGLEKVSVWLSEKVKCDKDRPEFHRVVVEMEKDTGSLVAKSTGMQRSSRVGSLATANGLLCLPVKNGSLQAWESCECLLMGPLLGW